MLGLGSCCHGHSLSRCLRAAQVQHVSRWRNHWRGSRHRYGNGYVGFQERISHRRHGVGEWILIRFSLWCLWMYENLNMLFVDHSSLQYVCMINANVQRAFAFQLENELCQVTCVLKIGIARCSLKHGAVWLDISSYSKKPLSTVLKTKVPAQSQLIRPGRNFCFFFSRHEQRESWFKSFQVLINLLVAFTAWEQVKSFLCWMWAET